MDLDENPSGVFIFSLFMFAVIILNYGLESYGWFKI